MNETEQAILNSLVELERVAKGTQLPNRKPDFQGLFAGLDALSRQLPKGTDPLLRHYLDNKSYEKARLLLQGKDAENARGRCGDGKMEDGR